MGYETNTMGSIYFEYTEGAFARDVILPLAIWSFLPNTRNKVQPIRVYTNIEAHQPIYLVYSIDSKAKTWKILTVCKTEKDVDNAASGCKDKVYVFSTIVCGKYPVNTITHYKL